MAPFAVRPTNNRYNGLFVGSSLCPFLHLRRFVYDISIWVRQVYYNKNSFENRRCSIIMAIIYSGGL